MKQYKEPRLGTGIYASVLPGEEVGYYEKIEERSGDVWFCILYKGKVGWIRGVEEGDRLVEVLPATYKTTGATVKTTTASASYVTVKKDCKIYEQASTGSKVFNTTITAGTQLKIYDTKVTGNGTWYEVCTKGYIGWIQAQ